MVAGTSTPIRVTNALLNDARNHGERAHRSATAQIEHWALIGRLMEARYSQVEIEAITLGVRPPGDTAPAPDLDDVLATIDDLRAEGSLATAVAGPVRYRANRVDPELIDEVTEQGVRTGHFVDGRFQPAG